MVKKYNLATIKAAQVIMVQRCLSQMNLNHMVKYLEVNCSWNAWSEWETCSLTCGGGTQGRNRTISQTALNNGTDCVGNDAETQPCNSNGCPGINLINF